MPPHRNDRWCSPALAMMSRQASQTSLTGSVENVPQLHLAFAPPGDRFLRRLSISSAHRISQDDWQVATPDSEGHRRANHPFANTGGVPPAPRAERKSKRLRRMEPSGSIADDDMEMDARTSSDASEWARFSTQWSGRFASPSLARGLQAAPMLEQRSRFGSLPLASPVEVFGRSRAPSMSIPQQVDIDSSLARQEEDTAGTGLEEEDSEDSNSKSRAWLDQCNAALTNTFGPDADGGWTPLMSPWATPSGARTPFESEGTSNKCVLDQIAQPAMLSSGPVSSPASRTRSKAKAAAAAQSHAFPMLFSLSLSQGNHAEKRRSSLMLSNDTTPRSSLGRSASLSGAKRPPIPWELRTRPQASRSSTIAAAAADASIGVGAAARPSRYRKRSSTALFSGPPYLPSPLGLGINPPGNSTQIPPFDANLPPALQLHEDECRSNCTKPLSGLFGSGASGVLDSLPMSRGNSSVSDCDSTSSLSAGVIRHVRRFTVSSSDSLGTPFSSAPSAPCAASNAAPDDYFGNHWRQGSSARRIC